MAESIGSLVLGSKITKNYSVLNLVVKAAPVKCQDSILPMGSNIWIMIPSRIILLPKQQAIYSSKALYLKKVGRYGKE
jgi:hypothetical protein